MITIPHCRVCGRRRAAARTATPRDRAPGVARCPGCGLACSPVYCAASTEAAPLRLAWTVAQAAAVLNIRHQQTLYNRIDLWGDGWRLRRRGEP